MALLSLLVLAVAIFLGFWRKMNTGLVALGASCALGRFVGLTDKQILAGFNYQLFLMLLGVSYLFSLAEENGTMELLAKKTVALAGKRTWLVPIIIYCFAVFLSSIGPGCIPTIAITTVFSMSLAGELGIDPVMLAALCVLGSSAGGLSPIAPTGIIALNLGEASGVHGVEPAAFYNALLALTCAAVAVYLVYGGHRLHSDSEVHLADLPGFNSRQWTTIAGVAVLVFLVIGLKINVGLAGFAVAAVLSFLRVAHEDLALKKVPWGALLLITCIGVLMNIIIKVGGIKMLAAALASVMTDGTCPMLMGLTAGCMSWFGSSSGVVMPTLIPTIPAMMEHLHANMVELVTIVSIIAHPGGISPLSTGGGLALAAYSAVVNASAEDQSKMFAKLFATSAGCVVFLSVCAYFGMFRWLL